MKSKKTKAPKKPRRGRLLWITRDGFDNSNYQFWVAGALYMDGPPAYDPTRMMWQPDNHHYHSMTNTRFESIYPRSWRMSGGPDSILEVEIGEAT